MFNPALLVQDWRWLNTAHSTEDIRYGGTKKRQAPGGERLPSHQKSPQTLGGVRLLGWTALSMRESRVEAVPFVKTLGAKDLTPYE
jgi:hypothetical protein